MDVESDDEQTRFVTIHMTRDGAVTSHIRH